MFYPGDIVVLKEPDDGDESPSIFVCYTKLYDNELDCVLIERNVPKAPMRYRLDDSNDYKLFPNTGLYTKDEIEFAKMLASMKCDITYGNTTFYNECAIIASSDTFDRTLCMMSEMIEKIHNPHELQFVINFAFEALAPYSTRFDKVVIYQ